MSNSASYFRVFKWGVIFLLLLLAMDQIWELELVGSVKTIHPEKENIEATSSGRVSDNNNNNDNNTNHSTMSRQEEPAARQKDDNFSSTANWTFQPWPGLSCHDVPQSTHKFVLVHVFKTAGSSFRRFLDAYGQYCGKSVAIITGCSQVEFPEEESNSSWNKCQLKSYRNRTGHLFLERAIPSLSNDSVPRLTSLFWKNEVDIAIGHLPLLGSNIDNDGDSTNHSHVHHHYMAFVRDPVAKYVSGRVYSHQQDHWTLEHAIETIASRVRSDVQKGRYYQGYLRYFTTPHQKTWPLYLASPPNHSQLVTLMQQNLLNSHVLMGVVERMGDSLILMQSVLDTDHELTHQFAALNLQEDTPATNNHTTIVANATKITNTRSNDDDDDKLVRNQSELSTAAIVRALQQDPEMAALLQEYLKYEYQLYDFAVHLHEQQLADLQKQKQSLTTHTQIGGGR